MFAILVMASHGVGCSEKSPKERESGVPEVEAGALYARLQEVVAMRCAFARCHGGFTVGAGLMFHTDGNFRQAVVNVPACEYDRMMRVEPGEPDKSWLMVKLTADVYDTPERKDWIKFTPEEEWTPPEGPCGFVDRNGTRFFGMRMPATAPNKLSDEEIEAFRLWIQLGAPGP